MSVEDPDPVLCVSCGARFSVERLSEGEYQALMDQHTLQELNEEHRMLELVSGFYRRYPEAEGKIKPHFAEVLESDDADVIEALCAGMPFDIESQESNARWTSSFVDWDG